MYADGVLTILDQTLLPEETKHIALRTPEEVAEAIKMLRVRGAPAIGIAAAYGVAMAARSGAAAALAAADLLQASRPTAVNLHWALNEMRRTVTSASKEGPGLTAALERQAIQIHEDDARRCAKIAEFGAPLFTGGAALTHCNTGALATGGVGTALGILRRAHADGLVSHVYFTETRPWWQGARLTAWELLEDGIPSTLLTDSAAGALFATGKVTGVVVGADRITSQGDVANKIGTYTLAVLAQAHRVPFYVAAPESTIDLSIREGREIPIEERSEDEVKSAAGRRIAPAGTNAWNPVFDVTPADLVTAIITERGVFRPPYSFDRAPLGPSGATLRPRLLKDVSGKST